jgi:hypothetical protein
MPYTDNLIPRATAAYYRAAKKRHPFGQAAQPSRDSDVMQHDGKTFVQLVNVNGTLAVYEVLTSGRIKCVPSESWPTA